jgi:hypothetical protein
LLVQAALQGGNFDSCEAIYDAFLEWVRDVRAVVLVAGTPHSQHGMIVSMESCLWILTQA